MNTKKIATRKIYPWIVISLCASLLFYKYALSVSPSIMAKELMQEFKVNGMQLGNLAATFFYTYTLVQLFSGILMDKFGARLITGCAVIISAFGAYLFSIADTLVVAIIARGMMGFGIAFATVAYLKMTAVWFKVNQLAFVAGLLPTAVMFGAVFGQAPLALMLEHTGWRFVLAFCAVLGLVIAILFLVFVRDSPDKPIPHTLQQDAPSLRQGFTLEDFKMTLKSRQNWLLTVYSGLAFAPLSVLGGLWGGPFLQVAYHLTRTQAAELISLMFIGLGVGGPLFGFWSDRIGKRLSIMKTGIFFSLILITSVLYAPALPLWLLATLLFLFGCSIGAFMLGFTIGTEINKLSLAATVVALINTGDSLFESFTEPLLGKLLDLGWNGQWVDGARYFSVHNYHLAFIPLPLYFVVGLILLYFVKEPERKKHL